MNRNADRPTQHVVAADDFHRLMYGIRRDASTVLRSAVAGVATAVRPAYEDKPSSARADADTMAGEVFARLHDGDQVARLEQPNGRSWERRIHDVLDRTDSFRQLCADVSGDVDFAALALTSVLATVAEQVGNMLDEPAKQDDAGDGDNSSGQVAWGVSADDAMEAALAVACGAAQQQVDDTREAMNGLAPGLGDAPNAREQADPRRLLLAERLRTDDRLRDVLWKAGRLQRIHARSRKTKTDGHTEVVDVERGGDLGRLLPSVLAMLDDPDLADYALADVVERKALQYALGGDAPLGRGPIVMLRDVSGSMAGAPHTWAAAVAILAAQVGAKERRQVTIVNYTSRVRDAWRIDTAGKAHRSVGGSWERIGGLAELVLDVASAGCGGGTRMDPALAYAIDHCDLIADRADLLLVTDGRADSVRPEVLQAVEACKAQGLRISGLTINRGRLYPALAQICDSTVDLDRSGDTAAQAARGVRL